MTDEREQRYESIRNGIEDLRRQVSDLARTEGSIAARLEPLEKLAIEIGDDIASQSIRKAFIKMIEAGHWLTQIHLDMIVPPTVFLVRSESEGPRDDTPDKKPK